MSYARVCQAMEELFGVKISQGGVDGILEQAQSAAAVMAEEIRQQVIRSDIIGSDETSVRVKGHNWWEWVFVSAMWVYHVIGPSRSYDVIKEMMGKARVTVWVCDCFGAQLKAPADLFQLCLAHQLRDLQALIDASSSVAWALEMRKSLREAIHLWKRFINDKLTIDGYARRVTEIENRLDQLLNKPLSGKEANRLRQRFIKHREHLLTFLYHPGVEPTNNACERALRPSVIHRKVINGFRSERGAHTYAALRTIGSTARLQGKRFLDELMKLFGHPSPEALSTQNS